MMFSNFDFGNYGFKLPDDWKYRGEGNSHVVLSLPKSKQILRIRKTKPTVGLYFVRLFTWLSDLIFWYFGTGFRDERIDVKFYMKVMRPLFGTSYVSEARQVFLPKDQVRKLEKELDKYRPEFRKHKVLDYGRATLFDDFTYFSDDFLPFTLSNNTFSFEFKPKQDWEPVVTNYPECIFCMNQYYKLETNKIKNRSNYCPRNLFSGKKSRVVQAIKSLVDTPQNNFRVFKNGNLIYSDKKEVEFKEILKIMFDSQIETEGMDEAFYDLIHKCLTKNLISPKSPSRCDKKWLCEWNRQLNESTGNYHLEKESVLEKILSVQMLNTEGTDHYNRLLRNKTVEDWKYVRKVLKEINRYPDTCLKCIMLLLDNKDEDFMLVPYLMAAVANDCSLMITLKKIDETVEDDMGIRNIVDTKYGRFVVRIGIFDLYPKPVSTVTKHKVRNENIFGAYYKKHTEILNFPIDNIIC